MSSAALIAYYNIAGECSNIEARELPARLDAVAAALASLVPIYTIDEADAQMRPLSKLELKLAEFRGGGAKLVHRDRDLTHSDLRINRCDLLEAIHALQDIYRPRR